MKILGIDYGRKKLGLAIAESPLAEPYKVLKIQNPEDAVGKVVQVVKAEVVDKVIVGISEGEMGLESQDFSLRLKKQLTIPVETFDETLTTQEAQKMAREAGIKRTRRRAMEDAYAAALMLQNYLDR